MKRAWFVAAGLGALLSNSAWSADSTMSGPPTDVTWKGAGAKVVMCAHSDSRPECIEATTNGGRGTLNARPLNCNIVYSGLYFAVGGQMQYTSGQWRAWNGTGWYQCYDGTTAVVVP